MTSPPLHIALFRPEIPPNTGNAGRLCLGLGLRLHVVHPIGFSMDEKAVRRAGLDYWKHVDLMEHEDEAAFWSWVADRRVFGLTKRARKPYTQVQFRPDDVLLFGGESKGLPEQVLARTEPLMIPMPGPVRSLNLSNAVAVVAYGAMQCVEPSLFSG